MKIFTLLVPDECFEDRMVLDCAYVSDDHMKELLEDTTDCYIVDGDEEEMPHREDMDIWKSQGEETLIWKSDVHKNRWYQITSDDYNYSPTWWY